MASEYLTVATALVTGLGALSGVWLADRLGTRRERTSADRQLSREKREQLEDLFARTLSILERAANQYGTVGEEEARQIPDLHARLALRASQGIVDQFEKTVEALNSWAAEARQGSPRPGPGGTLIFTSGFGEKKHNELEEQLWPVFFAARAILLKLMREALDEI
jgi:hypothetical protein